MYAGKIQSNAVGLGGICLHECHDIGFVAGVQTAQYFHGRLLAGALACTKADAPSVQDKGVEQVEVTPASLVGTLAEVIFFPIPFAEVLYIKQTDLA